MTDIGFRSATDGTAADLGRAAALYRRGLIENSAGRPLLAMRQLRRALLLLGHASDETLSNSDSELLSTRITLAIATAESELNGLDRGLRALDGVVRYVERTDDQAVRVLLHLHMGYMQVRGGHFLEGLHQLDAAVDLLPFADPRSACNILLNRGMLHVFLGNLDRARPDYVGAVDLAREHGLLVEQAKASHNLGEVEFFAGNLALALRIMDDARDLGADVSASVILLDRSRVLLVAGLHREADEALIEAGQISRAARLWKEVGEVELARAECALLDGQIEAARRLAASARTRFRRRGNDRWRRDAELVLLHADLAAGRPGLRLAKPALRLAEEFRAEGLLTQSRTAQLIAADALLCAGRTVPAVEAARAAGSVHTSDPISTRLHTRLVHARLMLASGRKDEARREIRSGLKELASHQAQFGSIDMQTASAVHGRELAELNVQLALGQGKPSAVLAAVEEGRAVSNRLQSVSAPDDPVAAELLAELRQTVEGLRATESDPSATAVAHGQRRRVAEIQRELRSRSWQAEGTGHALKPAKLPDIYAALDKADTNMVCYLEVSGVLHAVVRSGRRSRVVTIGASGGFAELARRARADLDVLASGYLPRVLLSTVRGSLVRSLAAIDASLIRSLGVSDKRLVIIPTGFLATVPWTNLPSLQGIPIVVAPSTTAWLVASGQQRIADIRVTAFAGPDLERAGDEVKAIGEFWPDARIFTERSASHMQLARAITSSTIVHVATHGEHQAENPLFSSIRLADGPLFAYELDQTARAAEHVILSACELGQATIRPGDEALGLTSVLLHLGTRSVISGVARVHDDVAAEVMTRYHRLLSSGVDSAQALAEACTEQQDMPAPFVCFGAAW